MEKRLVYPLELILMDMTYSNLTDQSFGTNTLEMENKDIGTITQLLTN